MKYAALAGLFLIGWSPGASAYTVKLGQTYNDAHVEAKTCFAECQDRYLAGGNASVATTGGEAQTRTSFGANSFKNPETSVHAYTKAGALKGDYVGADYLTQTEADTSLNYHFEIVGPTNIKVPVAVAINASVTVAGDFSSTGGGANAQVRLFLSGQDVSLSRESILQNEPYYTTSSVSSGFDASGTYEFDANTIYAIEIRANTSALTTFNGLGSSKADFSSSADVDPTFVVDPNYAALFHIAYSTGIGVPAPVPLPASAPLFGAGLIALGAAGFAARRKNAAAA